MLIPIQKTAGLIETSFAEAIELVMSAAKLPELKRRHWATSLRQVGEGARPAGATDPGAL